MLSDTEILAEFEAAEAILKGHFILSSGLHSDTYLQCARVLMNPKRAEKLCAALAEKVRENLKNTSGASEPSASEAVRSGAQQACTKQPIDMVVAPAMGGVVVGYEMGRQLGIETIFCERENGAFALRRGFTIEKNARVLLVEDVVTTGKSSLEAVACIESYGAKVVAEASLINRSGQDNPMPFALISLLKIDVHTFDAANVPDGLKDIPAIKPGSRWLQQKA